MWQTSDQSFIHLFEQRQFLLAFTGFSKIQDLFIVKSAISLKFGKDAKNVCVVRPGENMQKNT